jgi:hypothetical protein
VLGALRHWCGITLFVMTLCAGAALPAGSAPEPAPRVATPAPPEVITEIQQSVERARQRFEARDASGVLAHVSERYRSSGLTKPAVRQQLLAMLGLYEAVRARVVVDQVQLVDGDVWFHTRGQITGRLPFLGWMTVLVWQNEPEVARREGEAWRLFGFQD